MRLLQELIKSIVVFLFLVLSLSRSLTSVDVYLSTQWTPKSFFRFEYERSAHFQYFLFDARIFEATVFSVVALPGYLYATNCWSGMFSKAGSWKRYLWLCLIPWLISYANGWLMSIGDFLWKLISPLEASNIKFITFLWLFSITVQALLWSEVLCMALQGFILMRHENMQEINDLTSRRMSLSPHLWCDFKPKERKIHS